jgi:hypothetical protein
MDLHVLGEAACVCSSGYGLVGDAARRKADVLQARFVGFGLDGGRRHVRRAHDLLVGEAVRDRGAGIDAHHDRDDAKHDEDAAGDEPSDFEYLAHLILPSSVIAPR